MSEREEPVCRIRLEEGEERWVVGARARVERATSCALRGKEPLRVLEVWEGVCAPTRLDPRRVKEILPAGRLGEHPQLLGHACPDSGREYSRALPGQTGPQARAGG